MRPLGRGRASLATALAAFMCAGLIGAGLLAEPAAAGTRRGTIKICKSSKNGMTRQSSFTLNHGAPFKLAGGTCSAALATHAGSNTVVETPGSGVEVAKITAPDVVSKNLSTGTVVVNVKAGTKAATAAVVTYVNRVSTATVQTGYIEVCKKAADSFVTGSFDFTVTAPGFATTRSVLVGQCTAPLQVPAGNVSVSEATRFPFSVSSIAVAPANRLVTSNIANQTATVVVPAGDSASETLVTFWNDSGTGSIKVCKELAPNSGSASGKRFFFTVATNIPGRAPHEVSVVAGAPVTTTCVIDPVNLPLGTHVSITEKPVPNVAVSGVSVLPANRDLGSTPPTARLAVGSGITTATFTDVTSGTIEVCKLAADTPTSTRTFQFSVNGAAPITVRAGQCSPPIGVPSGTVSVYELGLPNFKLVGVKAVGPAQENRLLSGPTTNPAQVQVPTGGVENETVVTFTNAVATGQFKICKVSNEPTLQGVPFTFGYSYTVNGNPVTGSATLLPGQCSGLSGPIPVVDHNAQAIPVTVTENYVPQVQVSGIVVVNGNSVNANAANRTVSFSVNQGITTVTFTNVRAAV